MSGYTGIVDATPDFVTGTFDAQDVRLGAIGNCLPGLFAKADFTVTQRAAGANMSVDIAAGRAFVEPAGPASQQGLYLARTEAAYNTNSDGGYTWTAADATNPRIDLLCIEVADADEGGSFTGFKFRVVDGTPNASATHQLDAQYWPSVPNYVVPIAAIKIPAADTTIGTAEITNLGAVGGVGRVGYNAPSTPAETTTSTTFTRLASPDFVCFYVPHTSARVRIAHKSQWKISVASGTQGVAFFIDGVQIKMGVNGAAPATYDYEITSLGTFYSHLITNPAVVSSVTALAFTSLAGSGTDVSDVTTGQFMAGSSASGGITTSPMEVFGLSAGWHVLEVRFKTSANTLSVLNRRTWAEVIA